MGAKRFQPISYVAFKESVLNNRVSGFLRCGGGITPIIAAYVVGLKKVPFDRVIFNLTADSYESPSARVALFFGNRLDVISSTLSMSCYSGTVTSGTFENDGKVMKVGLQYISEGAYPQSASAVLYRENSAVASIAGMELFQVAAASDTVSAFNWFDVPVLE